MNKLKNVSVVPAGLGFQVIGNYKIIGETRFDDSQYKEVVLYQSLIYSAALKEATSISKAYPCGLFNIVELNASANVGEPLIESITKMKRVEDKPTITYNNDMTEGYVPLLDNGVTDYEG